MRTQIPPSLNWLANRRARAAGEIKRLKTLEEVIREELRTIEQSLQIYSTDLAAYDRVIAEHEVPVDPEKMPSIQLHVRVMPFAYGRATKLIHKYFRLRGKE